MQKNINNYVTYKYMFEPKNYIEAYNTLKSIPGNMTAGSDGGTLDGFSSAEIKKIIDSMKTRKFQFKPSKRIYIPKPNGQSRSLSIPSPKDKVVQKVINNLLTLAYEPIFKDSSHGFRPNKGCHTAINQIKKWNGVT